MSAQQRFSRTFALAALCTTSGCASSESPGEAFPNQRPAFDAPDQTRGYVANQHSDTVSVIDLDTFVELGQVPVGRSGVDIDGPRNISFDPGSGQFFVLLTYPLLDVGGPHAEDFGQSQARSRLQALAGNDLRDLGYVSVYPKAVDFALGSDGKTFYVTHDNDVLTLDTTAPLDERRSPLAIVVNGKDTFDATTQLSELPLCVSTSLFTLSVDSRHAFIACTGEDSIVVLDLETASVVARVPAGVDSANGPVAVAERPSGGKIAVSNQVRRTVAIFDFDSEAEQKLELVVAISVRSLPMVPSWVNDDEVLVPMQGPGGIARISVSDQRVMETVSMAEDECQNPRSLHVGSDGRLLAVCEGTAYATGTLLELDPSTLAVQRSIPLGKLPDELLVLTP
jgi:YVTN family beta-propeller protein